jgi:predicted transcriptional regulator
MVPDNAAAVHGKKVIAEERKAHARRLRAEGMTYRKIAEALDMTERTVSRYFET